MAYVSNMTADEDQKTPSQGAVPPAGGGAVQLAPSSGIGNVGAAAPSAQPGQPGAGGSFATLDKYLTANQGQAQPLADKLSQGIGQEYNTLSGQNASTLGGINQQVTNAPGYTASNPATLAAEAANPVSFANDQGNVKQFQGLLTNTYSGPASAQATPEYTNQQSAINNAIAQGQQQTTTEAGRQQLLSQNEAAPSASVTGLNSAILSQSPTALNQIESAYKPFSSLLTDLYSGAQDVNANIGKEQADAQQSSAAANKQIADQIGALNTGTNADLAKATAARDAYNAAVAQNQNVWNPVNTQVNSLDELLAGITQGQTPATGGATTIANPLGQYVNAPFSANAPTLQTVATPQEYAQANAFQNLLAGLNTGIAAPNLTPATAAQAGTYQAPTAPTITDPKAQAKALYDAMNKTISAPGPNNTQVSNPWFNSYQGGQQFQNVFNPQYQNLTNLLNKIYGSNIAASE
jgi:hypothetical protein